MVLPMTLKAKQPNKFVFLDIFNAPVTSEPSDPFKIQIFDWDKKVIAASEGAATDRLLSQLKPAAIANALVEQLPSGSSVVGQPTDVVFTVTAWHPIPPGGGIQLRLPRWDPGSAGDEGALIASPGRKVECFAKMNIGDANAAKENFKPYLKCVTTPSPSADIVTILDAFKNGLAAGQTCSFVVKTLKNPISMTPMPLTVTTFAGVAQVSNAQPSEAAYFTGLVDEGIAFFRPAKPSPIAPSVCKLVAKNQTVQERTSLSIIFPVEVPIHAGCTLLVTIPDDFQVDSAVKPVRGWGMFQSGP